MAGGDPRLANRVHFYVDTGNGIRPEAGVGGNVHAIYLDNLYDASADPLGIRAQASTGGRDDAGKWFNDVEAAIIDAGFDGVYIPGAGGDQGVAVLLGPTHTKVPVEQHGMHSMPSQGAYTTPASTKRKYAMLTPEIRKFEAQEAQIKAAAPSADLRSGTLTFDDADAEAIAKFFPPAAQAQIFRQPERGGFDPKRLTTILNEKADMSTFLHETAHFFLTVYADMAARPDATAQNKEDMQTILDWFGIKDLATWNALSLDEQRKYHESWAYNYEINYDNITEKTGMDCTKWLVNQWMDGKPIVRVVVHSHNAIGAANMMGYINNYKHINRLPQDCDRVFWEHTV